MSRNQNSRFALNPTNIDLARSRFDTPSSLKTSFNVGEIVPIFWSEILPGDSLSLDTSMMVRLQSLITPMMDDLYLDTYYFFVPYRLVWSHWQNFMGENTESAWIPRTEYTIPQIVSPAGGWVAGTLADYFGIPTGVNLSISALPFRAYALICNDWFRSENLQNPLNIPVSDSTITGVNTGNFVTDVVKGGKPYKACKFHDYFTSCLPYPQKGPDVVIPLSSDRANVYGLDDQPMQLRGMVYDGFGKVGEQDISPLWLGYNTPRNDGTRYFANLSAATNVLPGGPPGSYVSGVTKALGPAEDISASSRLMNLVSKEAAVRDQLPPSVYADVSVIGTTVNQLRLAFQIQKIYEKDARGGTRYIELLKSHFGVTSPDARLQRPEYLGGKRIPININQVVQQSETGSTPQGNVAGFSVTTDTHSDFTKSFVEHGIVIGLAVVRYNHTYQQGLERFWKRQQRFDFYWPALANIGEQPVYNYQIYATGDDSDDRVFGYNEAWAEYRYRPSMVTGEMRSNYAQSLDSWHLADDYESLPYLGSEWIVEDSSPVNRVIAVSDQLSNQLFGDFYFKARFTRAMPLYSIPGLIDHH